MPGLPAEDWECDDVSQLRDLVDHFAAISVQMSTKVFDAIGSLVWDHDANGFRVGDAVDVPRYDESGTARFGGPFKTLRDRYLYAIDTQLEAIKKGYLHRSGLRLRYLAYQSLREYVLSIDELAREEKEFYLTHPDFEQNNFMIDPKAGTRISAVVDWNWSVVVCPHITPIGIEALSMSGPRRRRRPPPLRPPAGCVAPDPGCATPNRCCAKHTCA